MSTTSDATAASIAQQAILAISKSRLRPHPTVFTVMYRFFEGTNQDLVDALAHRIDDPPSITGELVELLYQQHCVSADSAGDRALAGSLGDGIEQLRCIINEHHKSGVEYSSKLDQAQQILAGSSTAEAVGAVSQLSQDTRAMQRQIEQLQRRVEQAQDETTSLQEKLLRSQAAMMTDHLTGLGNRRFYEATLARAIKDVPASPSHAFLVLVDCDKFKSVNDTFGHPFGDEVIKRVGRLMQNANPDASIARLGGDEFAAFMRYEAIEQVEAFADRLRTSLKAQPIVDRTTGDALKRLTLSIGVAMVRSSDDISSWHQRADKLLYEAKRLGGDRVILERISTH